MHWHHRERNDGDRHKNLPEGGQILERVVRIVCHRTADYVSWARRIALDDLLESVEDGKVCARSRAASQKQQFAYMDLIRGAFASSMTV